MLTKTTTSARSGFTLIEILAVLLILTILFTFLMRAGMSGAKAVEIGRTEAFLQEVGAMVDDYNNEFGSYPPSTFSSDLDPRPSRSNEGIESLVITLWPAGGGWQASEVPEDALTNTDGDDTRKSLTSYSGSQAFELGDLWGNPLAYIHRRDYRKDFTYVTYDESDEVYEGLVKALISPKTGDPYRKRSFQLISSGPDGVFGTEDDIANFQIER
jgi:prepilin-type N-terminal cleavage/methylation domain-containing protein